MTRSARPFLHRFAADKRGAVAATYALALVPLIAVAGVGMDYARLMGMDSELQNGADQAALAAASQLDGRDGACLRAATAASTLIANESLLTSDAKAITIDSETTCDATGSIRFWQDKAKTSAATSDANAHFVEVSVGVKSVDYALLPVTGLMSADNIGGTAFAGLGSAICRVPPMMICNPEPGQLFNANSKVGVGIQVTSKGAASWGPGDFGFLEVGSGQKADLERALAFDQTPFDCAPIDGGNPQTGNAQGLYRAINTRFDIYDTNGNPLGGCQGGACPPARNVLKDLVKPNTSTGGNSCKTHNSGWQLPPSNRQFWPKSRTALAGSAMEQVNNTAHSPSIAAMGLTRDLCHYDSYATACKNLTGYTLNNFGNGQWARGDYFNRYHAGRIPSDAGSMTRYQTYKWELTNNYHTSLSGSTAGSNKQYSAPVCAAATSDIDRRVLTVAVVKNCSALSGSSTPVQVDEWVDMFLVEPVFDARGNGVVADAIYMEVIGKSQVAGSGAFGSQEVRRDVPYLIE